MLFEHSFRSSRTVKNFLQFSSARIATMVIETRHLKAGDPEPTFPNDGKISLLSMRFCPYAQRTHIILEAKKIPYHTFNINLVDKPEWLTKFSPYGKVPAIILPNEKRQPFIYESMIIADYLDEKYPEKSLYPKDPLERAADRLLIERFSIVSKAFYKLAIRGDVEGKNDIAKGLDEFEAELIKRGTSFFGGKEPGMLDYMIWPWVERLPLLKFVPGIEYEIDSKRHAVLVEWIRKMIVDPAVSVHYLRPEVHLTFAVGFKSKNIDYDFLVE